MPGYTAYLPAGLLLYAVDVVLRVVQQSAPVEVEAAVNSDGTIAGLYVQTVKVGSQDTTVKSVSVTVVQRTQANVLADKHRFLSFFSSENSEAK